MVSLNSEPEKPRHPGLGKANWYISCHKILPNQHSKANAFHSITLRTVTTWHNSVKNVCPFKVLYIHIPLVETILEVDKKQSLLSLETKKIDTIFLDFLFLQSLVIKTNQLIICGKRKHFPLSIWFEEKTTNLFLF